MKPKSWIQQGSGQNWNCYMVRRGLTPNILTYNTLISSCYKEGMMQESRLLLPDMVKNGIFHDNFTCWIPVQGYVKQGRLLSTLNMVVELQIFGVSVCRYIYDYLILVLCQENWPYVAKNLLKRMSQVGHEPKEEIFNELIYSLSKSDFVEEALLLKAEMVSNDMKPNLVTYKALIGYLCRLSRSVEGLINGLCKERNLDKAKSLLGSIVEEFQIYDIECCNALLKIYYEAGDVAKLMELQDRLLKVGFAPNSLTFNDHRVPEVIEKPATYGLLKSCTGWWHVPWSLDNLQQLRSRNTGMCL
ncbi:pentatricopeptide repeat-containing protein At5g40400-like [Camellia sinensis]|uniref:pentatricopeptide repeat-containing protein At5g40400-like n=1 Tax=Camellia sinensis TaxID=4442 RepID=UPI001036622D|nr:pentatricopeptide repeat-containing protein At5g40400-like [Camellia sinensis]